MNLSGIASVASFFVSRMDTEVDRRPDKIGTGQAAALRGKAAIANARLACQRYEQAMSTSRRKKSPERADVRCGPPPASRTRLRRHPVRHRPGRTRRGQHHARGHAQRGRRPRGHPDDSIHGTYEQSRAMLGEFAPLGIDHHDLVRVLEDQG